MAPTWNNETLAAAAPFEGRSHHCALMRQADSVVDYRAGEPLSNELLQYGGVFRASSDADEHFAEASRLLMTTGCSKVSPGTTRGVVQLALRFVREKLKAVAGPTDQQGAGSTEPLGHFAAQLAEVIATAEGDSATATSEEPIPSRSNSGRRSRALRFVERPSLVLEDGRPVVHAVVELPIGIEGRTVQLIPAVVTADGVDRHSADSVVPQVIGWTGEETSRTVDGQFLNVDDYTERRWTVRVRPVPDTVTRISFVLTDGAA